MPDVASACRTTTGLAAEMRVSVTRLARRMRNMRDASDDLTHNQLAVLATLSRCGDLSIGALAEAERVQPPSMTRIVANLVDKSLVDKAPDPDDGRRVVITLTTAGRDVVLASRDRKEAWLCQCLDDLTDDERRILRDAAPILDRLAGA